MASACLRSSRANLVLRPSKALQRPRLPSQVTRRHASTSSSESSFGGAKAVLYGAALAGSLYISYFYVTDTRASVHRWITPPLIRLLYPDAEDAHHAGTTSLQTLYALNLHPRERDTALSSPATSPLAVSVFGTTLANPIGISAGLDKHAEIPDALFALGAGVVEVGGCTPFPQDGNPRPRVFRVPGLDGMVNRYGLNSHGADAMARRLHKRVREFARPLGLTAEQVLDGEAGVPPGSLGEGRLLAVQIAKNKATDDKDIWAVAADYVFCVRALAKYADVLVVNVSSPNTPGLRDLQAVEPLTQLLGAVVDEAAQVDGKTRPKVMVKVSPDEDEEAQMEGIVQAVCASGVDGVIVGNTTKRRAGVVPAGARLTAKEHKALMEDGGYSGPAMFDRTLDLVGRYRKMLDARTLHSAHADAEASAIAGKPGSRLADAQQKVIFATGGITNGQQALKVLEAGASVAMVYTGMTYGGPGTVTRIKREMVKEM